MRTTVCPLCGAPVIWTQTAAGKLMPVDATPNPDGNVVVDPAGNATVDGSPPLFVDAGHTVHLSHFVSCPDAAKWRKS